jgi:hypothetical protein
VLRLVDLKGRCVAVPEAIDAFPPAFGDGPDSWAELRLWIDPSARHAGHLAALQVADHAEIADVFIAFEHHPLDETEDRLELVGAAPLVELHHVADEVTRVEVVKATAVVAVLGVDLGPLSAKDEQASSRSSGTSSGVITVPVCQPLITDFPRVRRRSPSVCEQSVTSPMTLSVTSCCK